MGSAWKNHRSSSKAFRRRREGPSPCRQWAFMSTQIRATRAVSRDQEKENWHLLFALSPSGSTEKIQPKQPNPAFEVNILGKKKKKLVWYWRRQHRSQPCQPRSCCLPPRAVGRALPAPACDSQHVHPGCEPGTRRKAATSQQALPWGQAARRSPRSGSTPHGSLCPSTPPEWSPRSPVGEAE